MSNLQLKEEIKEEIYDDEDIGEEYVEELTALLESKFGTPEFDDEIIRLSRMKIEGFKAIKECDVPLASRSTIIHGKNSMGKSSFIEAVRFNLFGRNDDDPLVTKPINLRFNQLTTDGYWSRGNRQYLVHREMERKRGYEGHDQPKIIENPEQNEYSAEERLTQSEVDDLIGITPLYERGFNRFGLFSLFSIISGHLRAFYHWEDAPELIDLLFGIEITGVTRAIDEELDDCEITDEEREAKTRRLEFGQRASKISEQIEELVEERQDTNESLNEALDERAELSRILEGKTEIDTSLSEKIDLKDEISDLQSRIDDKQDEHREVKQEISKLEAEAVTEELAPALQEVKQLVALPNRCPVCTNQVDQDQQQRFDEHGECPLCQKDVPEDRYDTVSEVDEEGEVLEKEKRQEELEDLEREKRTIEGTISHLEDELEEKKERLENLNESIEQSEFADYKAEKEEMEARIESLRSETRTIEKQIQSKKNLLHGVAREVKEWDSIEAERQRKERRREALEAFKRIAVEKRKTARRTLKNRFEETMESFLPIFSSGTFEQASGVRFSRGDDYSYTIYTRDGEELEPDLLQETDAELVLHMLVFHATILAELEKQQDNPPLKLLLIDSPYANGIDDENEGDITSFLSKLPDILDGYQIIVAMANSNLEERDSLRGPFDLMPIKEHI